VLDERGRVVASSHNMAGRLPVAQLRHRQWATIRVPFEDDPFLAIATVTDAPGGRFTIVVARTMETVGDSIRIVTGLLAAGLPILLLMVGMTTWKATGRALRPVESIRGQVEEISAAELHRRSQPHRATTRSAAWPAP
jgi:hypothetical protein